METCKYKLTDIDDFEKECQITLGEFKACVKEGFLLNSDGFGYFGTETQISDIYVDCNPEHFDEIPAWATHVYWFNK